LFRFRLKGENYSAGGVGAVGNPSSWARVPAEGRINAGGEPLDTASPP
jgi:hypothetical protein